MKQLLSRTVARNKLASQMRVGNSYKLRIYSLILTYPYSITGGGRAKFIEYLNSFAIVTKVEGQSLYTYGGSRETIIRAKPVVKKEEKIMYTRCARIRIEEAMKNAGIFGLSYFELMRAYYGNNTLNPNNRSDLYPKDLHAGFQCFYSVLVRATAHIMANDRYRIAKSVKDSAWVDYIVANEDGDERFADMTETEIISNCLEKHSVITGELKYDSIKREINEKLEGRSLYQRKAYFYEFNSLFENREAYTSKVVQEKINEKLIKQMRYSIEREVTDMKLKEQCNAILEIWIERQLS